VGQTRQRTGETIAMWPKIRYLLLMGFPASRLVMKQLFLLRHAKAVPPGSGADDRDRPLDERGIADIGALRAQLRQRDFWPERVLCSPAIRTRQTLEPLVTGSLLQDAEVLFDPALYLALATHLFEVVQAQPEPVNSVLIVGHNPGLHQLALALAGQGQEMDMQLLAHMFPPLSLATLSFTATCWRDISLATGTLDSLLLPERYQASAA
jgi:phosphohistidine phosphatase